MSEISIFTGNSNPVLAQRVSDYLYKPLGNAKVNKFSDGEIQVEIQENVRLKDVYIIQSTCDPVNDNLMELVFMVDALRRASVKNINAVIPYFGYSRQDKKVTPRVPISAKVIANILVQSGVNRVITMDLHAGQIQGFFDIPVDNIFAAPVIIDYIKEKFLEDIIIISPDAGGVERARAFAKRLNAGLAIVDKRRDKPNQASAMHLIGDVKGKIAVILDDMVDTAGTLTQASNIVYENGALEVHACCSHAVLSGPAIERIEKSSLKSLIVTDTIPLNGKAAKCPKIIDLSISGLIGEAIIRTHNGDSVNTLFV